MVLTYDILIQPELEGTYRATVLGWPDLSVAGDSEQVVIERIQQEIRTRLAQDKIIRIEVDDTGDTKVMTSEHPWQRFLGMWKDDPTFDDLLAKMEAYRRELDEMPE